MRIAFYISGHGFGHASRSIELINALAAVRPDVRVIVRSTLPAWLFESAMATLEIRPGDTDTGVVQFDSLRLDEEETARRAAAFHLDWDRRVAEEGAALREMHADAVLGDIPPLAFAAASSAGLPSVALGNFTWDWIYGAYPAFEALAPEVIPAIRRAYAGATGAMRLPLHGGFEPMADVVRDIPFIARRSTRDPGDTRRLLGVPADRPLVLASFGADRVELPYDRLAQSRAFSLVTVERQAPNGLSYPDLVAAADVVVSKPGYGIVSECVANHTALLYTSRGHFIEYDVFVAGMPDVLRCRYITNEDLLAGRWEEPIGKLLAQADPPTRPRVDGAHVAAAEIVNLVIE